METRKLLEEYLGRQYMMQLATVSAGQPWCCTVYFVTDEKLNLYWASLPTRRHSKEIGSHSKVAVAIPVKFVNGEKVVGVQAEGTAECVTDSSLIKPIAKKYAARFKRDAKWIEDFSGGKTEHKLYKLTPASFVIFDEENFPDDPRQEVRL